jgi:AraC-like DNA-binding protein
MPSALVQTFTDPDEYAPIGQNSHNRLRAIKRPVNFAAKFTAIELPNTRINHFSDTLPRIARVALVTDRIMFAFMAKPGPGPISGGVELKIDDFYQVRCNGQEFYHQTFDASSYVTLSLPPDAMGSLNELASYVPTNDDVIKYTPPPAALAKLRRLREAAGSLAEDAPAVIEHQEAARGLEQSIIEALVDCLGPGEMHEDRAAQRHHGAIMRRFHRVVEEHLDEPLYIPELCREVGASVRTLNTCCQEHLGMGPKHYLLLRRMHMVRRALRQTALPDTTVTEVATRYGFWQLGRFAVEYKTLFGESPSDTLAHVE